MIRPAAPVDIQPRLFSRAQAAAYCGISENQFDEEVKAGTFPAPFPLRRTRRVLWDRVALDRTRELAASAYRKWNAAMVGGGQVVRLETAVGNRRTTNG